MVFALCSDSKYGAQQCSFSAKYMYTIGESQSTISKFKQRLFFDKSHVEVVICGVFGGSKKRGEFIFAFIAPGSLRVLTWFTSLELFYNITNLDF